MIGKLKEMNKGQRRLVYSLIAIAIASLLAIWASVSLSHDLTGVYLLKGENGKSYEVANSLFLGDEDRLIAGIDLFGSSLENEASFGPKELKLQWNKATGQGYIRNQLGDGTELVTNFSLYRDSQNQETHGLFIGGAIPSTLLSKSPTHENNSGMTWFDGKEWNHIWCNTNEGIGSSVTPNRYAPSAWTFLGSRIIEQSEERIVMQSSHEVRVDKVPLHVDRSIVMVAGEPYLDLRLVITNVGSAPSRYFYYYGDEPWIGDFGGSQGDIGWTSGQLVKYEEKIDPRKESYAGMVDLGNDVIGEGRTFRNVANFIDWSGADRPDVVFFANNYEGVMHDERLRIPLQGNTRSLGMYWAQRTLLPGQRQVIDLTIGMAQVDPVSGLPKKPTLPHHMIASN